MSNERGLFRGRCKDGKWIQGDLTQLKHDTRIYPAGETIVSGNDDDFIIDPATIGQSTGLRDKNGTLIWEGDILRVDHQGIFVGPVHWEDAQWFGATDYLESAVKHGAKVIGNVHDTPELLQEAGS